MALKTFVKIGSVTNLSDARYCAGMGVDILGFNVDENSENYTNPEKFEEVTSWISGVKFALETSDLNTQQIENVTKSYKSDYLEVNDIQKLKFLNHLDFGFALRVNLDSPNELKEFAQEIQQTSDLIDILIISSSNSEVYAGINEMVENLNIKLLIRDFGIAGDLNISDLAPFNGIHLEGTPEEQPGFKDYGKIMDILESIEED